VNYEEMKSSAPPRSKAPVALFSVATTLAVATKALSLPAVVSVFTPEIAAVVQGSVVPALAQYSAFEICCLFSVLFLVLHVALRRRGR